MRLQIWITRHRSPGAITPWRRSSLKEPRKRHFIKFNKSDQHFESHRSRKWSTAGLKVNWGPTEYSPIVYIARCTLYLCMEGVHVYTCTCVLVYSPPAFPRCYRRCDDLALCQNLEMSTSNVVVAQYNYFLGPWAGLCL